MSFADWKKRNRMIAKIHWAHQDAAERACQAAYKAGERQGRKDAKQVATDAKRYQWLKSQKRLTLSSRAGGTKWTRKDGTTYTNSHYLAGNDMQYAAYETLDETIYEAMKIEASIKADSKR